VAIVQNQTTLRQSLNCNGEIGSEDDDFEETISFYLVPKGPDQASVNGSIHPQTDKHSKEGQEDHLEEQEEDFEIFDAQMRTLELV
jgi:hypothetical protein